MHLFDTDNFYPQLLKNIPDYPHKLNYLGEIRADTFTNCVAVVGSRNMSLYGQEVVNKLVEELSNFKCVLVSGFTRGVDITLHKACLHHKLPTVAVLPSGLDYRITSQTRNLIHEITQNKGVVISEYDANFEPKKWSFIKRNRIVAGMSIATVVIEAAENSGSLITANFAHDFTRPVFAIPGSIFNPLSAGTHKIIKTFGKLITSGTELAGLLDLSIQSIFQDKNLAKPQLEYIEQKIIDSLRSFPMDAFTLSEYLNSNINDITGHLMNLVSSNAIIFKEGTYYVKES